MRFDTVKQTTNLLIIIGHHISS